jgi:CubicO group peptidase (beta-lactamase class C family)
MYGWGIREINIPKIDMRFVVVCGFFCAAALRANDAYPPPGFTDPERVRKLESAMPEVDGIFRRYANEHKIPGMVWGVVIDARLAHFGSAGVRDLSDRSPLTDATAFRIASMTKSFTALAILKLRDEGKLSLDDPVTKWIPEFARVELPTRDSAPLRIRQIMSHSAGFPEDNPWGDQQLSATEDDLTAWLRGGIPFSTPPGTRYEYSNFAFGLLGRIVTKASGMPYEKYVRAEILAKLHMDATTFEFSDVPAGRRAVGYRLQTDGTYLEEAPLPHGVFGSTGGLLTTATDLSKYLAFHLSAWPPRDDVEAGPVLRASVREMSHLWTPSNLTVSRSGGVVSSALKAVETGYGYGLRVSTDCRFEHIVAHGGGLPGFGSYMSWVPEDGVAIFAMANLTYAGPAEPISQAWDALLKSGGLRKRELPASPVLSQMRAHIVNLWNRWDDAEAKGIAAMNLFIDTPAAERTAEIRKLKQEVGACSGFGPVIPENWLRGQFNISCEKGTVGVFFTLAPTQPPGVQHLAFRKLESDGIRLSAPTGGPAGGVCPE